MYIIQTPQKYLQGSHLLDNLGEYAAQYGDNFLILSGRTILKQKGDSIIKSLDEKGLKHTVIEFCGESTREEIDRVSEAIKKGGCNAVIGIGGGKALDTAKAAAFAGDIPVIIVPSIAASDAPCSCEAMIYSEEGEVLDCLVFPTNPDLVLVDTDVIACAPADTLISGIGDALATYIEARVCYENNFSNVHDMQVTETAIGLSKICYDVLMENALDAVNSVREKNVTPALEKVVEANIYLSGVGFENGGLSLAHAVHDALTLLPECHKYMHGYKVAFGSFCQLILEGRPEKEILDYMKLSMDIGLPLTLAQVGITENADDKAARIASNAYITDPKHECKMPPGTTEDEIKTAIICADAKGRAYLAGIGKLPVQ